MNRSPLRRAVLFVLVVTLMPASLHADDIDRLAGLVTRKPAPHVSPESIQRGATDWAALIDSTWGTSPLTRNDRAIGFDHVWDTMDEDYACWQDLPLDWDAVKTQYTSEAASPVISRGRFAAIMSRMGRLLKDGHTAVTDTGVSDTTLAPGVPLFNFSTWGFVTHAGMSVTPQADTSGLIYDVVPGGHPLGVVPGDRILGYDGRPWIDIYPELLDVHELPSTGVWDGTTDSSKEHGLLGSSAGNWHLFDTIDIVKHDTGEVQHLPTSLFTGLTGVSMYASEQLSVAGVADPVFGSNWVTSGVITGTNIGYINVRAWQPATGLLFEAAIDQLTQQLATDGLIVDFRNNLGGNMFESNTGLSILFEAPTPTLGFDQRCGDPDDHFEMCAAGAPSTWSIPGNPATSYANKVAVLTGPGSISAGDQVALRFKFLPNAQWFGKATSATFNGPNQIGFASPMNVDWFARYCGTDGFLLSDVGEYLTHDEQAVDCNVWLEEDDVAVGVDTVLQAALGWIDGTHGDLDLDTVGDPCDNCPNLANASQADSDFDGAGDDCDCAPSDPHVYPGAIERNDGVDNQCAGDAGFGLVDESGANSGFYNGGDADEYLWFGVPGTADYQVARSSSPEFDAGCVLTPTTETILVDAAIPVSGAVFFYLNRPLLPTPGSWGKTSAGAPRAVCGT